MGKKVSNKKGKKERKNHVPSKKWEKYQLEGTKVKKEKSCPKCGAGVYLANHKDRLYCGSCHYVEWLKKP